MGSIIDSRISRVAFVACLGMTPLSFSIAGCADDADTPHPTPTPEDSSVSEVGADSGADSGVDSTLPDTRVDTGTDTGTSADTRDAAFDADVADSADAPTDSGTAADCLASTTGSAVFTITDTSLCVVAAYTLPSGYVSSLTWGRHGGPLGFDSFGSPAVKLVRWAPPSGATGALTSTTTTVNVPSLPSSTFYWDSQALDLPFYNWTAIAYAGTSAGYPGELVLASSSSTDLVRYNVNGYFSESAVGLAASGGRLLYTGLSPLATSASTTNAGGLYAADRCGSATSSPRLLPDTDTTCGAPLEVATWESGSSGPIAADYKENVFAILSTFSGKQELRGFESSKIARGGLATNGTKLFSIDGYTGEMVADGSKVVFQSHDSAYKPIDVQAIDYTVDATAKTVNPSGSVRDILHMVTPGTGVALLVDDKHRVWVGVADPATGDAGPTSSTFYVLRKKTP